MTRKQTQRTTHNNRLFNLGKKLLLSFFVGVMMVAGFVSNPKPVEALDVRGPAACTFNPAAPKTYASRVYVDKMEGVADRNFAIGQGDRFRAIKSISPVEPLVVYVEFVIPAAQVEACKDKVYEIGLYSYNGLNQIGRTRFKSYNQIIDGNRHLFYKFSRDDIYISQGSPDKTTLYVYPCDAQNCGATDTNFNEYIEAIEINWRKDATGLTVTQPTTPLLEGDGSSQNLDVPSDYSKVQTVIKANPEGKGLRTKYRVAWNDSDLNFGSGGLDPVHMEWGGVGLVPDEQFLLTRKDNGWGWDGNPYFIGASVYLGFYKNLQNIKNLQCSATYTGTECSSVFREDDSNKFGKGATGKDNLPGDYNPVLYKNAWKDKIPTPSSAQLSGGNEGKPLGANEFAAVPAIFGGKTNLIDFAVPIRSLIVNDTVVLLSGAGSGLQKFTVEVYANLDDVKKACKADPAVADKSKCDDDNFARFGFSETVTQTTSPSEQKDGTPAANLFDFLRKVVAYLVIMITGWIYYIFSLILVPILSSLLSIHPYQDKFVDFIYPGWVIMRNLANIAFIIALLVMGLRILFQVEDAAKSRWFIIKLILMALLVNFSLVIAQGVVAIADTVQSQFLPGDTKVIEALGTKLMVDPILTFRSSIAESSTSTFTATEAAADLPKAIVLLILSVAAFFSFVAIIGFVAVRIVALWVLYMLSPFAYFGQVLPQTQQYANQWWSEFIKYAITVPVLAFFLNMAALIANTFSVRNGTSVEGNAATGYIFGGVANDLVAFALTVASHFIVLIFIFLGMKYALSSGTAGSKEIVKFAKKGFENLTTRPAKWAGKSAVSATKWGAKTGIDLAADSAAGALNKKGYGKMANAVSFLAQPKLGAKALKDKLFDAPKKKQQERLAGYRKPLESLAGKVGMEKWQATKILGYKLIGKDASYLRNQADLLKQVLTDNEVLGKQSELQGNRGNLINIKSRLSRPTDKITKRQGEVYNSSLEAEIEALKKEKLKSIDELEKQKIYALTNGEKTKANSLQQEIDQKNADYSNRISQKESDQLDISGRLSALPAGASANTTFAMADNDAANRALSVNADVVNANISKLEADLANNDSIKKKYNLDNRPIDDEYKETLLKQASELETLAAKRDFAIPQVAERIAEEREQEKKYEGIDDPEALTVAFEEALKKNNFAAASALAKKLAKEGGFKDLLAKYGYKNNVEDLKKFADNILKGMPVIVRNQWASEVSYISAQNGNRALGNATTIDANRVVRFNTISQQQKKLATTAGKKPLWERSKGDLTYQDSNGKYQFNAGEIEKIKGISKNPKSLANLDQRLNPEVATHIMETLAGSGAVIDPSIKATISQVASRYVKPNP